MCVWFVAYMNSLMRMVKIEIKALEKAYNS